MQSVLTYTNKDGDLHRHIFCCPEESLFYAACIRFFLFQPWIPKNIIEFGAGDGSPVLEALGSGFFQGRITGYEINAEAAALAEKNINASGRNDYYRVLNSCFFESFRNSGREQCLMANPPYIPALDPGRLLLPHLWGGSDGTRVLRRLLDRSFRYILLLMPGISDPARVIDHALEQGYRVQQYMTALLPFGRYTSQEYVQEHLQAMRRQKQAFFYETDYILAGVLFSREAPGAKGLEESLLGVLAPDKTHSFQA